jgi:hypothetical protein
MRDDFVTFEEAARALRLRVENIHQLAREGVIRGVRHEGTAKLTRREFKYLTSIVIPGDPPKFRRNKRRPMPRRRLLAWIGLSGWILALLVFIGGEIAVQNRLQGSVEDLVVGKNTATAVFFAAGLVILVVAWCLPREK